MAPIELATLGTPVLALLSRAIEPMLRQTFAQPPDSPASDSDSILDSIPSNSYDGFASELLLVLGERMGKLAGWRAAYWMWGPIEEDSGEIDLAKGSPLKSWSCSQRPIGDGITSPDAQANFGTTNTQSRPRHQKCVIRRPTYPTTTRVELQERRVRLLALNLRRQKAKPSPRSTITRWASSGTSALLIRKRTRLLP
ncbi:uncharacterized protein K444DRAFT_665624 [Hyaloscypha bicolor E]|uniref:Uncharacterized protein n=1 Tax=Hyaloscypha bicolor E TaxID=1095630 RepID=A0A2J6T2G8_9HELO|nr:uncharacterized protein K444DRAFT_665624 [Hyaloscypha bicolor E]PMD57209.1 hypothetical protein K444DRAFT_665624 [Hyaloscypha bicolor E]